ncbi:hypothetical protein [Thauera sinica]|uniref:Lipoprotein n=1 Tax=Thauera sinica TaxID=2665146 RepID=A0ABW1ASG8_9RHOO|nr:hypothetical protein [Thauera sp. K11]ATE62156.1 hypothetical protein CCZ27_21210 [Thauera sp. K11]
MTAARVRHAGPLGAVAAALLAAACATPLLQPSASPELRPGAGGRLKPMPVRPLDIRADCRFKDEAGYGASTMLDVSYAEVKAFSASVDIPRRGSCRFDGEFAQVRRTPHVELRARDGCTVSIWEQGEQVTVAFNDCAARCTRGAFDYVWPIIVDRRSGQCH